MVFRCVQIWVLNKGTASLEVKKSERNCELENFASLEPRVCEVLLYFQKLKLHYFTFSLELGNTI